MNHREKIPGSVQSTWPEFPAAPPHGERTAASHGGCHGSRTKSWGFLGSARPEMISSGSISQLPGVHGKTGALPSFEYSSADLPPTRAFLAMPTFFGIGLCLVREICRLLTSSILKKSLFGQIIQLLGNISYAKG